MTCPFLMGKYNTRSWFREAHSAKYTLNYFGKCEQRCKVHLVSKLHESKLHETGSRPEQKRWN